MLGELDNARKISQNETSLIRRENEEMKKYIRRLERDHTSSAHGAPITQLKSKQGQNRKLKELSTRAQRALYFVELFGLELECLKLKEKDGPQTFSVGFLNGSCRASGYPTPPTPPAGSTTPPTTYHTPSGQRNVAPTIPPSVPEMCTPPTDTPSEKAKRYASLNDNDKATVESLLFLMDKFGVGDQFMHELSMILEGCPKSYLLKECRSHINSYCHIKRTPGKAPGAQFSFLELLQDHIRKQVIYYNYYE